MIFAIVGSIISILIFCILIIFSKGTYCIAKIINFHPFKSIGIDFLGRKTHEDFITLHLSQN